MDGVVGSLGHESSPGLYRSAKRGEAQWPALLCPMYLLVSLQVDPYLPYEYTCEGMLERIHAYIQHQVGGPSVI